MNPPRKLAAIFAADVAGYSWLTGLDLTSQALVPKRVRTDTPQRGDFAPCPPAAQPTTLRQTEGHVEGPDNVPGRLLAVGQRFRA
jgi:hypothetical protein